MKKILKIIIAQLLTLFIFLVIIAIAGQIYTFLRPGYKVLDVIPDRDIGWRLVPNATFTYTGHHWYENEFKTQIKVNSLGFRDKERTVEKHKKLIRMVVIGDSSVAAHEVAFEKTPAQLLEGYLNGTNPGEFTQKTKYEVLNFGIGGFGIGQNFLTNRVYVKDFSPNYVFLFIFEGDIWRTISPLSAVTNKMSQDKMLSVRPTLQVSENQLKSLLEVLNFKEFHQFLLDQKLNNPNLVGIDHFSEEEYAGFIEKQRSLITRKKIISISQRLMGMTLLVYPARDFDKFVSLQNETIISEFNGQRTRIREQRLFILELGGKLLSGFKVLRRKFQPELRMKDELELLIDIYAPRKDVNLFGGSIDFPNFEKVVFVNLKTVQMMRGDVESYGGNLIVVDATSNLIQKGRLPANLLSTILEKFCDVNDIGYIPLYQDLNTANLSGQKTRWSYDGHLNELGYKIFAESMYRWLQDNESDRSLNN